MYASLSLAFKNVKHTSNASEGLYSGKLNFWKLTNPEIFSANISSYSHYVFSALDQTDAGVITFEVSQNNLCMYNPNYWFVSYHQNNIYVILINQLYHRKLSGLCSRSFSSAQWLSGSETQVPIMILSSLIKFNSFTNQWQEYNAMIAMILSWYCPLW